VSRACWTHGWQAIPQTGRRQCFLARQERRLAECRRIRKICLLRSVRGLTPNVSSTWGAPGPADGSAWLLKMGESGSNRTHATCVTPRLTNGPVRDLFHSSNASLNRVAFRRIEPTVCVEFTVHPRPKMGCSDPFLPTLGRSSTVRIFNGFKSRASPTPECSKIDGVPTEPAESTISFLALTTNGDRSAGS
jgi:hypothetical protein